MKNTMVVLLALLSMVVHGQQKKKIPVKTVLSCCVAEEARTDISMKQFAQDSLFLKAHDVPAPFVFEGTAGESITFPTPDGRTSTAQVWNAPQPTGNYLVVIHEYWGLNDYVKRMSEQLRNDLGNVNVVAVDLYDGKVAASAQEASQLMRAVNPDRAKAILRGLYAFEKDATQFLTLGWCFGGGWSLQASLLAGDKAGGCVVYYGMPETNTDSLKALHCEVLGIFANQDQWITPAVVDTFQQRMKAAGKELELHRYDADHAFANPSQTNRYNAKAADDAYYYVKAFLSKKLDTE